jgi:hypothetical protein
MTCPACQGQGAVGTPTGGVAACPVCGGNGDYSGPGRFKIYEVTLPHLNANANAKQNVVAITDAPFKWLLAMQTSTGVFTSQIRDGATQRPFFNQEVHRDNFWGNATQGPFPILVPYTFPQMGSIQVDVTDISAAGNDIRLAFIGVELDSLANASRGR